MKFGVNVDKNHAFMIVGAILILAGTIYVNAQNPAIFGHDWSEIENLPEQATRWANWSEIGEIPDGFADGVDDGNVQELDFGLGDFSTFNIGADRNCFAFIYYFNGPCRGDSFNCLYNSTTGDVIGGKSSGCGYAKCGYLCYD